MSDRDHTPYQKGIIRRYYEHKDTLALQKLGDLVSNMYVETSDKKLERAWKTAHKLMLAAGVHAHEADNIRGEHDLGALARLIARLN